MLGSRDSMEESRRSPRISLGIPVSTTGFNHGKVCTGDWWFQSADKRPARNGIQSGEPYVAEIKVCLTLITRGSCLLLPLSPLVNSKNIMRKGQNEHPVSAPTRRGEKIGPSETQLIRKGFFLDNCVKGWCVEGRGNSCVQRPTGGLSITPFGQSSGTGN